MASIYEKPPHILRAKLWDEKTSLSETYKLQSNDTRNKVKAEVHLDSGQLGIEFTVDKTIPDFNKGAEKIHLDWTHSFLEFENCLLGQYKTAWKQILHEFFPEPVDAAVVPEEQDRSREENFRRAVELFIRKVLHEEKPRDRQYIYLAPGGDYNVQKPLVTKPIDHLHRWEELLRVAELLPAGDIITPSAKLQVEWFYMTFHKSDRVEYVRSGRKLREENLQTLTEYFESIYDSRTIETTYARPQAEKVRGDTRKPARHELQERYARKMRHFSDERSRRFRAPGSNDYYGRRELREGGERHYDGRDNRGHYKKSPQVFRKNPQGYSYRRNPQERGPRKSPQDFKKGGSLQPCHLHGPRANHSYAECRLNPRNQAESKARDEKRAHDSHHQDMRAHDNRYMSSDDESRGEDCTPVPSDGEASASVESKVADDNYHLGLSEKFKSPKKRRVTFVPKQSHKSDVARLPKEHKGNSDIEWDDTFDDGYLTDFEMGLESEDADLQNGINPFAFDL